MARENDDPMLFSQGGLQAVQMVDFDVVREIFLGKMRHIEHLQEIPSHIDEGIPNGPFRLRLRNVQRAPDLPQGQLPLLLYEFIVQDTETLAQAHQKRMRQAADHSAHKH